MTGDGEPSATATPAGPASASPNPLDLVPPPVGDGSAANGQPTVPGDPGTTAVAGPAGGPEQQAVPGTPNCTDNDIRVVPVPERPVVGRGAGMRLTITVKNSSTVACARDVGTAEAELYLQQGGTKVWSSDACDTTNSTAVRTLVPNIEHAYYTQWRGTTTSGGCNGGPMLDAGTYELYGRIGTKVSEPVKVTVD